MKFSIKATAVIIGLLLFTCSFLQAQTKDDAAKIYNQGVNSMSTNLDSAIIYFEKSIELSNKIGADANDIKDQATRVLPGLYYKKVAQLAQERKLEQSIAEGKIAIKVAEKYNDNQIKEETQKLMAIVYFTMGNNFYKMNNMDNAIMSYDSTLAVDPSYTKAYINKAMVFRRLGNNDKFSQNLDSAIVQYKAKNDSNEIKMLSNVGREHFEVLGSKANQTGKLEEALKNLNTAAKYGYDDNMYYQFADVYNKMKKYDDAITNAQKGLELVKNGNDNSKAKFYYQLGIAQMKKGEKDSACGSFKHAEYGAFARAAHAQMVNNKCPGVTVQGK